MPADATLDQLVQPRDLADAIARLAADAGLRPLAGGTAIVPLVAGAEGPTMVEARRWLTIAGLPELNEGITEGSARITFGAMTRLADLASAAAIRRSAPLLGTAVAAVASPAIRNAATIGGSVALGPASPDPATALLALGARLVVARPGGLVEVALGEHRGRDLIVSLTVPLPAAPLGWAYERLSTRGRADRPVVTVAIARSDGATIVAVGAICRSIVRLRSVEAAANTGDPIGPAAALDLAGLPVVDDDRASAGYRRRVTAVLLERMFASLPTPRGAA